MTFLERFKDTTVFTEQSTGVTKNCAGFEAKQKSKSSWPTARGMSGLKSGKFCTVLLGTHFYAF